MLVFSTKGFYIKDIGYFYFEPVKDNYKKVNRFKKVKTSTNHKLKFIPDSSEISKWYVDGFQINSDSLKMCDTDTVEFLKSQKTNGININKRVYKRNRK